MQFLIDFVDFIISTVRTVWDFFLNFVSSITLLIKYLGIVMQICLSAILTMPDWLQAFGMLTITVSILYMTLGRNTGGKKQ